YCVEVVTQDASSGCPSACMTCDFQTTTCVILGNSGNNIHCPSGWNCQITCMSGHVCGDVWCGLGKCSVSCFDTGACGDIDCHSSCQCDVTCPTGDCGALSCPMTDQGNYCTTTGNDGQPCQSSVSAQCHSC